MKIDQEWLAEKNTCREGVAWFLAQKETEAAAVLKALIAENKLDWANWLIVRVMIRPQYLAYAIFSAEQVIDIFERKYTDDKRPRKSIEAAKAVLRNDTEDTRSAAKGAWSGWGAGDAEAAAEAALAAAWAAVWAAWTPWGAAQAASAAAAASEAARAAWIAEAAWSAGDAEAAAKAALAAEDATKKKILIYGLELLQEAKACLRGDGK